MWYRRRHHALSLSSADTPLARHVCAATATRRYRYPEEGGTTQHHTRGEARAWSSVGEHEGEIKTSWLWLQITTQPARRRLTWAGDPAPLRPRHSLRAAGLGEGISVVLDVMWRATGPDIHKNRS